ncbi:hypothetical protein ACLMJK_002837 [Lecanora helva]
MTLLQNKGKWLSMASYTFDVHLLEMFFTWRHGMSTVTAPRPVLLDNLELALQKLKVTNASFVPSLVDSAGLDPANLPDLRYMRVGGEKITKRVIETWSRSHVVLANTYGPTEVTIGCCFKKVGPFTNTRNVGYPLPCTSAHVLRFGSTDYELRGTAGELCLTGDLVANGYYKRPEATGFVEDFRGSRMYRTGDRVRLMADGSLEFLGRDDDQTKIRGQRIELGEVSETVRGAVERVLGAEKAEATALVVSHPSFARSRLVAFVATPNCIQNHIDRDDLGPRRIETDEDIRVYCSEVLPSFMVPDHILRLVSMPLVTISRKIDYKQLRSLFANMSIADLTAKNQSSSQSQHTLSSLEVQVRDTIAEVLTMDTMKIDIDSNPFQLGLDSLNAISLTIMLQKQGFESSVSGVLRKATLRQLTSRPRRSTQKTQDFNFTQDPEMNERSLEKCRSGYESHNLLTIRPCLPLQETLVASSMEHEGQALYVNHVILELSPRVNRERLIQAWEKTAEEHDILRTCFHEFENQFVQVVLRSHPLTYKHIDIPAGGSRLQLRELEPVIASDIIANIESQPPIRLTLATSNTSGEKDILLVSLHHALYDAESFSMVLDEVFVRYQNAPPIESRTPVDALMDQAYSLQGSRGL